ncbi:MAG: response regulator transcription factor [Micrococcales bacterium]|nr:response regulator transcription factor [Micrococcales bacterium]
MRVVLAEDSVLLREGLVRLLAEDGHEVVAGVGEADQIVPAVQAHRPDVLIADVRMPPTHSDDGLRAAVAARAAQPDLAVLVLSNYVEATYARELLADGRGGVGYLLKNRIEDLAVLHQALSRIGQGGTVVDPEVIAQLLTHRSTSSRVEHLTPRERDVLTLIAEGRSNAAIGQRLYLSAGAVEKHISAIFAKLNLPASNTDNRRVLAVLAYLHGDQTV